VSKCELKPGIGQQLVNQIGKVLHCHFPDLENRLMGIVDPRKHREYKLSELLFGGIMLFVFKEGSRNAYDLDRKEQQFRENYENILGMRMPGGDAIDDVLCAIDPIEIERLKIQLMHVLIAKKVFHKFRLLRKYFIVSVDGTGICSYKSNYCGECTSKTSKNGKTTYYHHVLEAKLITTNDMAFSIGTEWIRNETEEYEKQDCEINAFKRLAKRIKKNFPRLPIVIVVDGLYANEPFFKICKEHGWEFIVTFKDGNLPSVHQEIGLLPNTAKQQYERQIPRGKNKMIKQQYTYINQIEYQKFSLSYIRCNEDLLSLKDKGIETVGTFVHLSSFAIDRQNYHLLSQGGRLRWAIENSFDYLKNHGYNLGHKYSRVSFRALRNYYQCMMLAHAINQFIEKSSEIQCLKKQDSKVTIKYLWKRLIAFLLENKVNKVVYDQFVRKRGQIRLV